MELDDITVRLLTVLNAVNSKRPVDDLETSVSERPAKLNKKKAVVLSDDPESNANGKTAAGPESVHDQLNEVFSVENAEDGECEQIVNQFPMSGLFYSPSHYRSISFALWSRFEILDYRVKGEC